MKLKGNPQVGITVSAIEYVERARSTGHRAHMRYAEFGKCTIFVWLRK